MFIGLHNQFAGFELPDDVNHLYKTGIQPLGSKKRAKLLLFLEENKINNFNELYDYYLSLGFRRLENESDAELKNRSNFQRILAKFKSNFYNYSVYEKQ